MKKLTSLLLAAVMCLSLAACGGGPDKQPAIDAYNKAADAVNEIVEIVNQDPDTYADIIDVVQQVVDDLNEAADVLENEKLDQATLDQLVTACQTVEQNAIELKDLMVG